MNIARITVTQIFILSLMTVGIVTGLFMNETVSAQSARQSICQGIGAVDGGGGGCAEVEGEPQIGSTISTILNILSLVVGVISVIMIIIGGLKFVTSQGDGSGTASARNTVIYALVGLVIVSLAQIIVRFVVGRL